MLGRRPNKPGGGVPEQGNKIIAFDGAGAGHTEATMPSSSRHFQPPKLFLATSAADEVAVPEHPVKAVMSPTSILQAGSSTSPAGRHVLSRRPWEARPVGLGLAGALTGEATGAETAVLTGKTHRSVRNINAPSCAVGQYSTRPCLSPAEMEASEDYTRVIARGPNARTVHIIGDHVSVHSSGMSAGGGKGGFLRWCHGCSKDLGQGKDIFMYRGEMAFCSHECRYREMLFDEKH